MDSEDRRKATVIAFIRDSMTDWYGLPGDRSAGEEVALAVAASDVSAGLSSKAEYWSMEAEVARYRLAEEDGIGVSPLAARRCDAGALESSAATSSPSSLSPKPLRIDALVGRYRKAGKERDVLSTSGSKPTVTSAAVPWLCWDCAGSSDPTGASKSPRMEGLIEP